MPSIIIIGHANIPSNPLPQVDKEIDSIQNALTKARQKGYANWRELSDFSFKKLATEFNDAYISSQIRMLHYIGHSNKEALIGQQNGVPTLLEKEDLVAYLKNQKNLKFIFLNSCYSAEIAKELSNAGVPIVVGTTDKVSDNDASLIAAKFYETLGGQAGKTLLAAFEDTSIFFKTTPDSLSKKYHFRGLKSPPNAQSQEFAWEIYYENATEDIQNWCLLPPKKYILSEAKDDNRKKVFCLYGKLKREFYDLLALNSNHPKFPILINSLWEIDEQTNPSHEDLIKEWNAASVIVHFLNEDYAIDLGVFYQSAIGLLEKKNHIFINVDASHGAAFGFLATQGIGPHLVIPSAQNYSAFFTNENTIDGIIKKAHLQTRLEKFEKILLPDLTNFFSVSEDLLSRDLEDLDFENEKQRYSANLPKLYFTLIEGSPNCAQTLLVKKIKKRMGIGTNVKVEVLKIADNPMISDAFSFGYALIQLLRTTPKSDMIKTCVNAILDKKEPFVLVFENVNFSTLELYQQTILKEFWNELVKTYEERTQNANYSIQFPLMIFALNYEPYSLPIPSAIDLPSVQIEKISPVSPLSENEYNDWYFSKEKTYHRFQELITNKNKIVGNQRKTAMIEICKSLNSDYNIIVSKALELS